MTIGLHSSAPAGKSTALATLRRLAFYGACASLLAFAINDAEARPGGGGGFKGGAGISRGGGGFGGLRSGGGLQRPQGSMQRPGAKGQRPNGPGQLGQGQRPANANSGLAASGNGNSANRANVQSKSGNTGIAANGNTGVAGSGNGNTGVAGSGNGNGNTGVVNNGNVNTGTVGSGNVNTGNVVAGNDVDVNVENGGWSGYYGSGGAYATGVAVGATTTAAVAGSTYYSLPSSCATYVYGGVSYYSCGGTWYQQRYQGSSVTYVVVSDPTKK